MKKSLLSLFAILLIFNACKKDEKTLEPLENLPYGQHLKTFNDAAISNGLDIEDDLRNLLFETVDGYAEANTCTNNVILIPFSLNSVFDENFREQYIFHQLGHCILNREHTDEKFPTGEWKSLMRNEPYFGGSGQAIDYNGVKKEYYLQELFKPTVAVNSDFITNPIPFDETKQRTFLQELQCGDIYPTLIPANVDCDIELKFTFSQKPTDLGIFFRTDDYTIKFFMQTFSNSLILQDFFYGFNQSVSLSNLSDFDQQLTFTIRRLGDIHLIYENGNFLFAHPASSSTINGVDANSTSLVGCLPEIRLYSLE